MNGKSGQEILHVKSICKNYGRTPVLRELSLVCHAGERVAVMGPSGSGKSTLLNCLAGLEQIDAGEIFFNGQALHALPAAEMTRLRREQLTSIFQFFHLLPTLNAFENVEFPLLLLGRKRLLRRQRVMDLLAEVGLSERHAAMPAELSGGELQRLAIARALITEPLLLLADEPTGSLDSANGALILNLLQQLTQQHGTALVMVTHDAEAAAICQRTLHLRDGKWATAGEAAGVPATGAAI